MIPSSGIHLRFFPVVDVEEERLIIQAFELRKDEASVNNRSFWGLVTASASLLEIAGISILMFTELLICGSSCLTTQQRLIPPFVKVSTFRR
jgi:hypothetical protein